MAVVKVQTDLVGGVIAPTLVASLAIANGEVAGLGRNATTPTGQGEPAAKMADGNIIYRLEERSRSSDLRHVRVRAFLPQPPLQERAGALAGFSEREEEAGEAVGPSRSTEPAMLRWMWPRSQYTGRRESHAWTGKLSGVRTCGFGLPHSSFAQWAVSICRRPAARAVAAYRP